MPLVEPELLGQRAPLGFNATPVRLVPGTPRILAVGFFSLPQIEDCLVALLIVDRERVDDDVGVCQGASAVEEAVKRLDAQKLLPTKRLVLVLQPTEEALDKGALDAEIAGCLVLDDKERRDRRLPTPVPLVPEER